MYLYTEYEIPSYSGSKVITQTDRHTHTNPNDIITYPHTRMVINLLMNKYAYLFTEQTVNEMRINILYQYYQY